MDEYKKDHIKEFEISSDIMDDSTMKEIDLSDDDIDNSKSQSESRGFVDNLKKRRFCNINPNKKKLFGVCFFALIYMFGWGVTNLGFQFALFYNIFKKDASKTAYYTGWLRGVDYLTQFLGTSIFGVLSDVYGRKRVLFITSFGTVIYYSCYCLGLISLTGYGFSVFLLFTGSSIGGLSSVVLAISTAYSADISENPEEKSKNVGMVGASFGFGFIVAAGVFTVIGEKLNYKAPFFVATILSIFNVFFILFGVQESLHEEKRQKFSWSKANPFAVFPWMIRIKFLPTLTVIYWCIDVGAQSLIVNWVLYMNEKYGFGVVGTATLMLEYGVLSAVAQGVVIRYIQPKLGDLRIVIVCTVSKLCTFTIFFFSNTKTLWAPYFAVIFFAFGSMSVPSIMALISRTTDDSQQGKVIAGAEVGRVLMDALSNFGFASLYAYFISDSAPAYFPDIVVLCGIAVLLVALTLSCYLYVGYLGPIEAMERKFKEKNEKIELVEMGN